MNMKDSEMDAAKEGMKQWRNSSGHYKNIMGSNSNTLGASLYKCGRQWYLTQLFGNV